MLIWYSDKLLSMGLPDSSQPVTITIVEVMMAIRCLKTQVREINRQQAPTDNSWNHLIVEKILIFLSQCIKSQNF